MSKLEHAGASRTVSPGRAAARAAATTFSKSPRKRLTATTSPAPSPISAAALPPAAP